MALALFTIVAAIVEPSVLGGSPEFSAAADGQAPDTGPTKAARASAAPSTSPPPSDHVYDTVITGGRVMDPESGYDRVANVGIDGGSIAEISEEPLEGKKEIDATDRVVAPGFIDIESYDPNPYGIWYKIGDGVTTNLGMHGTNGLAEDWYPQWEAAGSPAHFGGAFDDNWYRQIPDGLALGRQRRADTRADRHSRRCRQGGTRGRVHRHRVLTRVRAGHHL